MTVFAHLDPDGVREPCAVAADGSGTVGALVAAVHGALALDRPVEEWEFFLVDGDGVEVPLCEDGAEVRLEDVGIIGAKEEVVVRLGEKYVRRQELRGRGIDGEDAAWQRYCDELLDYSDKDRDGRDEALGMAMLIAGSGWLAGQASSTGFTALHLAVVQVPKELDLVQLLVENGSDPSAGAGADLPAASFTPVRIAAQSGHVPTVRLLLDLRAEAHPEALCDAAWYGHVDIVRALLDAGADIDAVPADDPSRGTALLHAAATGHAEVVRVLLARGAGMDWRGGKDGWQGRAPLSAAIQGGHVDVMRLLLDGGAAKDATSGFGRSTPLHEAVRREQLPALLVLLRCGAAVNAVDRSGLTPLHHAASAGNGAMVQKLIEYGASVHAQDKLGNTPLDMAKAHPSAAALLQRAARRARKRPHEGGQGPDAKRLAACTCGFEKH